MTTAYEFHVQRNSLNDCTVRQTDVKAGEGQVLLRVDSFALTANNITYATMGETLRYWEFFPTAQGTEEGIIPVWGFAEVLSSSCAGIACGERFYGFYPMATHVLVEPNRINNSGFFDNAVHRQPLPAVYNQYLRCSKDPLYSVETEALQMLLRPLFTTSFLLDDFFADKSFFAAETLVITSASSKTAMATAYLLHHYRNQRELDYKVVGLTSPTNQQFVKQLGCYDQVLNYDQVTAIKPASSSAIIDFAGNGELLARLHKHLGSQLQYTCLVGVSHWDQRAGLPDHLPGPVPQMFFAPSRAEKRLQDWGGEMLQQRIAERWHEFIQFVQQWLQVEQRSGSKAVEAVYRQMLSGRVSAQAGYILSLQENTEGD